MTSMKEGVKYNSDEFPNDDKSKPIDPRIDLTTSRSRPDGVLRQSSYAKQKGVKSTAKNLNQGGQTLRRVSFCGSLTEGKLHGSMKDLSSVNFDLDDKNFDTNFDDLVRVATGMKDPMGTKEQRFLSGETNEEVYRKKSNNLSTGSENIFSAETKNQKAGVNHLKTSQTSSIRKNTDSMINQSSQKTFDRGSNHIHSSKKSNKKDSIESSNRVTSSNPFFQAISQKYSSHDEDADEDLDMNDVYALAASAVAAAAVDSYPDERGSPNKMSMNSELSSPVPRFDKVTLSQQSNLQWSALYSNNRMDGNISDSSEENNMTYGAIDRYMTTVGISDTIHTNKTDRSLYDFHSQQHGSSYIPEGDPIIQITNNYSSLEEEIGSSDESRNATIDVAASFDEIDDVFFKNQNNANGQMNYNEDDNSFHGHMILTDDDESSIEYNSFNFAKKSFAEKKFQKVNIPKLKEETELFPNNDNEEEIETNQDFENVNKKLDLKKDDIINAKVYQKLAYPDSKEQSSFVETKKSDSTLLNESSPKWNPSSMKSFREDKKSWAPGSRLKEKVISWTPNMISTVGKHTRLRRQVNSAENENENESDSEFVATNDLIKKVSSDSDDDSRNDCDFNSAEPEGYIPTMFLPNGKDSLNTSTNLQTNISNRFHVSFFDSQIDENNMDSSFMQTFISEHKIFLRAVLQLLAERDRVGIVANADDPNTIKTGPLRKSNTKIGSMWKVKYVEIRRGLFSYYENSLSEGKNGVLLRKNILLRSNFCKCRPLKMKPKSAIGYVFELTTEGEPRRLWMTNSKSERHSWIEAIDKAMIGTSLSNEVQINSRNSYCVTNSLSQFNDECKLFLEVHELQRKSESVEAYLNSFSNLWGATICVPLAWVLELDEKLSFQSRQNQSIKLSSTNYQSLKCISENDVTINGFAIEGNTSFATERIVGALCRCILEYDQASNNSQTDTTEIDGGFGRTSFNQIDEFQAICFARNILLSCNKLRKDNYGLLCASHLLDNPKLVEVHTSLNHDNPLKITVGLVNKKARKSNHQVAASYSSCQEVSGWVATRSKPGKNWKRRFFVLSGRILSYYTHEHPRPHGLRGKLDLTNAIVESSDEKKLSFDLNRIEKLEIYVSYKDKAKERYFCFDEISNFMLWKDAIEAATDNSTSTQENTEFQVATTNNQKKRAVKLDQSNKEHRIDSDKSSSLRVLAKTVSCQKHPTLALPVQRIKDMSISHTLQNKISTDFIDHPSPPSNTSNKTKIKVKKRSKFQSSNKSKSDVQSSSQPYKQPEPTILVSLEVCFISKVRSCEVSNDEEKDTLAMIQSKVAQKFFLSGGQNGSIVKSDDLVELKFLKGLVIEKTFDLIISNKLGND